MISGAVGAVAMIIPGISGSFLLLALGTYATVIGSLSDFNIPLMIPTAIGILLGLLCGAYLVRTLMEKVPAQTYGSIFGLVVGSIFTVFPFALFGSCLQNLSSSALNGTDFEGRRIRVNFAQEMPPRNNARNFLKNKR